MAFGSESPCRKLLSNYFYFCETMLISELIGRRITNIYVLYEPEVGGLDQAECFIELDNLVIIGIPFEFSDEIRVKKRNKNTVSIFADLSDYPVYHVNKDKKNNGEIAENHQKLKRSFLNRVLKVLFGYIPPVKEYQPYKVEYRENKLKYVIDKTIVDFLWYPDEIEKGFFLLDNGYIITETNIANHGTGLAGLNYFESLDELKKRRGDKYNKLSSHQNQL